MAVLAFATPIVLGVGYTAGASVGADEASEASSHTVDQWTISEGDEGGVFTLDRESVDGVVTLVVTGPDGEVVPADEFPDFVADAADEFGDTEWQPNDPLIFLDDGRCYDAQLVSDESNDMQEAFGYAAVTDDTTHAVELFADGRLEAVTFDRALSQAEIDGVVENNGSYFDLPGAQAVPACE